MGLRPDANLEAVEDALAKRKKLEQEMASTEMLDFGNRLRRPTFPALEPQVWSLNDKNYCYCIDQVLMI